MDWISLFTFVLVWNKLISQGSRTSIDRRGYQQVNNGNSDGNKKRKEEPIPFSKAEVKQILQADKIIGLLVSCVIVRSWYSHNM